MSNLSKTLRCLNPRTGKRDGKYCTWEGQGKCLLCMAADEIDALESWVDKYCGQPDQTFVYQQFTQLDAQLDAEIEMSRSLCVENAEMEAQLEQVDLARKCLIYDNGKLQAQLDAVHNEVPQWVEFTNDPATHPTDEEVMGCFGDSYSVPHFWRPKERMWKALEYINHYKYRYFWRRIGECDRPYTSLQTALNGEDDEGQTTHRFEGVG